MGKYLSYVTVKAGLAKMKKYRRIAWDEGDYIKNSNSGVVKYIKKENTFIQYSTRNNKDTIMLDWIEI